MTSSSVLHAALLAWQSYDRHAGWSTFGDPFEHADYSRRVVERQSPGYMNEFFARESGACPGQRYVGNSKPQSVSADTGPVQPESVKQKVEETIKNRPAVGNDLMQRPVRCGARAYSKFEQGCQHKSDNHFAVAVLPSAPHRQVRAPARVAQWSRRRSCKQTDGPTARQSIDAQLDRQPTPGSVAGRGGRKQRRAPGGAKAI
jgi:hypothetical protein